MSDIKLYLADGEPLHLDYDIEYAGGDVPSIFNTVKTGRNLHLFLRDARTHIHTERTLPSNRFTPGLLVAYSSEDAVRAGKLQAEGRPFIYEVVRVQPLVEGLSFLLELAEYKMPERPIVSNQTYGRPVLHIDPLDMDQAPVSPLFSIQNPVTPLFSIQNLAFQKPQEKVNEAEPFVSNCDFRVSLGLPDKRSNLTVVEGQTPSLIMVDDPQVITDVEMDYTRVLFFTLRVPSDKRQKEAILKLRDGDIVQLSGLLVADVQVTEPGQYRVEEEPIISTLTTREYAGGSLTISFKLVHILSLS